MGRESLRERPSGLAEVPHQRRMLVRNSWWGTSISPFVSAFEFYLTAGGLAAIVKNLVQRDGIGVILEIQGAGFIGSFMGGTAKFLTRARTSPGPGPFSIRTQGLQRIAKSRADGL